MPYRRAEDEPGSWHHVMNRGIARRTVIEGRADARVFLAALARSVRRGWLEVHAYCLMTTHYHLLVRSPQGRLADAMHRIQLAYSRSFNRGRLRDGPLVRNRYRSKPVRSLVYRRVLVAYIDANPVQARIVGDARDYPYGSARHYATRSGPAWLERSWVESEVLFATGQPEYQPGRYPEAFGAGVPVDLRAVAERRIVSGHLEDPLDELIGATPDRVLDWMRRKAALADGTRPWLPICEPPTVERVLEEAAREGECWSPGSPLARTARAGLCHQLTGAPQRAIAVRMGCSMSQVSKLVRAHRRLVGEDEGYAERVALLTVRVAGIWSGDV